jgi:hypothetical protein
MWNVISAENVAPTIQSISIVKSVPVNFTGVVWKPGSITVPRRPNFPVLTGTDLSISETWHDTDKSEQW